MRHFVTLIEICMHLIGVNPGHIWSICGSLLLNYLNWLWLKNLKLCIHGFFFILSTGELPPPITIPVGIVTHVLLCFCRIT